MHAEIPARLATAGRPYVRTLPDVSGPDRAASERGGTRTHDHLIKSQVLTPWSCALWAGVGGGPPRRGKRGGARPCRVLLALPPQNRPSLQTHCPGRRLGAGPRRRSPCRSSTACPI